MGQATDTPDEYPSRRRNDNGEFRARFRTVNTVIDRLKESGISSRALHIGILCCIGKESNFRLKAERGHKNTPNDRIRRIFGKYLGEYGSDDELLNSLKANSKAFFNQVYGNRNGNGPNDGHRYRGRGFNQLTFKSNYKAYSYEGVDLVANPDLLNDVEVAANVCIAFFEKALEKHLEKIQARFDIDDPNDIDDSMKGLLLAVNINAGIGKKETSQVVQNALSAAYSFEDNSLVFRHLQGGCFGSSPLAGEAGRGLLGSAHPIQKSRV